jgi:hypothetical protein
MSDLLTTPRAMALCTVLGVVAVVTFRDPAPLFVFDAAQYWSGAQAVISGANVYNLGGLGTRGVMSALVYVPAAHLADVLTLGAEDAPRAVLLQNAIAIAALGGVLIPLVLRRFVSIGPAHVVLSTSLTVLLLSGFAPYPLMDLPALLAVVLGLLLVAQGRWWQLVSGGAMLGVAVNLRPSYLVAVILVGVLVIFHRRLWALLVLLGAGAPLAFQAWYGWRATDVVTAWPPGTATVTAIQLTYAGYGVRYDTIPYTAEDPRRWYCNPDMAQHAVGNLPETTGELATDLVHTLPESALFALQKVTSSLQWSWATPYSGPGTESMQILGILASTVTVVGLISLVVMVRTRPGDRFLAAAIALSVLGCAVVTVGSAPESRFALPLVVGGVIGSCVAASRVITRSRVPRAGLLLAVALVGLTLALGADGLSKPAPRGDVNPETCASLAVDVVGR